MKITRRLSISVVAGALLGLICVLGGSVRAGGFAGNEFFLLGMWYNRVIIGLVIGLASDIGPKQPGLNRCLRGALLGFVVSLAFFLSTGMSDIVALFAGIVYGVIIEFTVGRFG